MIKQAHTQFTEKLLAHLMWEAGNKGFTSDDLADLVGGSRRTYENYKYEDARPSLAGFIGMVRVIKPRETLRKLAAQAGGYFIQIIGPHDSGPTSIAKQTADIMKETADVVDAAAAALRDGKVTSAEKNRLVNEIDEAIEALLRARVCLTEQ